MANDFHGFFLLPGNWKVCRLLRRKMARYIQNNLTNRNSQRTSIIHIRARENGANIMHFTATECRTAKLSNSSKKPCCPCLRVSFSSFSCDLLRVLVSTDGSPKNLASFIHNVVRLFPLNFPTTHLERIECWRSDAVEYLSLGQGRSYWFHLSLLENILWALSHCEKRVLQWAGLGTFHRMNITGNTRISQSSPVQIPNPQNCNI